MTNEDADVGGDDEVRDELQRETERTVARREVMWLTLLGLVLTVVAGIGTWMSRWDTSEFGDVGLVGDRILAVPYPCNGEWRADIEVFDDRVEIAQTERQTPHRDDCDSRHCVVLAQPLGDRTVINALTGAEVFVRVDESHGCGSLTDE